MRRSSRIKLATVAACLGAAALWPSAALADWVIVANEGQVADTSNSVNPPEYEMRYGAQGSYTFKKVKGQVPCTNEFFGTDPKPGAPKYCALKGYYYPITDEGREFSTTLWTRVVYGQTNSGISWLGNTVISTWAHEPDDNYGNWIVKAVYGRASCTNSYFGADPWQGVGKSCFGMNLALPPEWLD